MLTKEEIYGSGLLPVRSDLSGWGRDGVYVNAVPYVNTGNSDLFYKLELRQEPIPPSTPASETWITVFTYPHLLEVLKSYTYYETLRKVKASAIEADEEMIQLYTEYSKVFWVSFPEFAKMDMELVKQAVKAIKNVGMVDWENND